VSHARLQGRKVFYKSTSFGPVLSDTFKDLPKDNNPISSGVDGSDSGVKLSTPSLPLDSSKSYAVHLDGYPLRTPARRPLLLPTETLAAAIAHEWSYQKDYIEPTYMPLTTLASTAVDQIHGSGEAAAVANCLGYFRGDTVCYYAPEIERGLRRRQEAEWEKVHSWAEVHLGPLDVRRGISLGALNHPAATLEKAERELESLSFWELTVVQSLSQETKSLLLPLALLKGAVTVEEAINASRVEEEVQIENWGCVEGGHDMDRLNIGVGCKAGKAFLDFLKA